MRKKIAVIFGTRPDTIKLAPIILELQRDRRHFDVIPIATAQHRHMLDQVLDVFRITPRHDLNIMRPRQSLAQITHNTIDALEGSLSRRNPIWCSCREIPSPHSWEASPRSSAIFPSVM